MKGQPLQRARHRHEWRDLGPGQRGDWRYRCVICQRKSRNPWYQLPQFRGRSGYTVAPLAYTASDRRAIERRLSRRRAR